MFKIFLNIVHGSLHVKALERCLPEQDVQDHDPTGARRNAADCRGVAEQNALVILDQADAQMPWERSTRAKKAWGRHRQESQEDQRLEANRAAER